MSATVDSATTKKKWCVMVYLAADVDLESAAKADLEQMKAAGSSNQVDILAQVNPGGSRAIRRYHLHKDTYLQEDLVPTIHPSGKEHLLYNVDAKQDLIEFVRWCANRSEAQHYALILWGHGQGWKADNPDPCFVPGAGNPRKTIREQFEFMRAENVAVTASMPLSMPTTLLNGETGFLTNIDLRNVLAEAKKILCGKNIDILGMDACLMAMAEICNQVYESVDYLIACEDTVPDESWPYDSILKLLVTYADRMTPEDFSRIIVSKFVYDFGQKRKFVTQSICRLGQDNGTSLNNFTTAVERLVVALLKEIKDPETRWAAMIARSQVQSYYIKDYVDLYDFCRLLSANSKSEWIVDACAHVMKALHGPAGNNNGSNAGLVVDHGTYGHPLKGSFGVSIFFPCVGEVPQCYPSLEFCQKTKWHEFLNAFLHSPEGRPAMLEIERRVTTEGESEWPSVVVPANDQPPVIPATQPALPKDVNVAAPQSVATVVSVTPTGVILENNNNGNVKLAYGDSVKTTYGDVVKTSHGDPIKTPTLPSWLLPSAPNFREAISRTEPEIEPRRTKLEPPGKCGCGQNS